MANGKAETSTALTQDKDLTAPLGLAVLGDRVFVSCSPDLFVCRDVDGDLKADSHEVFDTSSNFAWSTPRRSAPKSIRTPMIVAFCLRFSIKINSTKMVWRKWA